MKSREMIDQVSKLRQVGHPIKKISEALGISRNTVRKYLRAEQVKKSDLRPSLGLPALLPWQQKIGWSDVCRKRQQGYTAKQLYEDYQPAISYTRFVSALRQSVGHKTEIALRQSHQPGQKVQVDFCQGIAITDPKTGKSQKTHLFLGSLPFSSYSFGCFVHDQKLNTFIECHERMWAYFRGVVPYVVIDNLKSGVVKAHRYDPVVNPTFCDYGNHCNFAVLPARPYTPRDKACVEANLGAIQRDFFQRVRDRKFYSISDLNSEFAKFLAGFNRHIMKDHGVSRQDRFELEKQSLHPLPETAYEIFEMKEAKVHPDCCVQVKKCFYSAPYRYRGQIVRVKITDKIITIFDRDTSCIASHKRAHKIGSVVSETAHFPESHLQFQTFDIQNALQQSKQVGPKCHELVKILVEGDRPLKYLRRIQGIFRLLDRKISRESLEYAISQSLTFERYQLSFIKLCAEQHQLKQGRLELCRPSRDLDQIFIRGGYDV